MEVFQIYQASGSVTVGMMEPPGIEARGRHFTPGIPALEKHFKEGIWRTGIPWESA